jgi:cytochrome c oxidase subunit 2
MKRHFIFFASVIALIVVLSACGSKAPAASPAASTPTASVPATDSAAPVVETGKTEEITVTAKSFDFDKKEIHVKKGDKIKLTLVNGSGAHGLEIPDLGVKLATAGTTEFIADKVGEFEYNCALMCGTGHDVMVGKFIVE